MGFFAGFSEAMGFPDYYETLGKID